MPHICILGGGFGGLYTALELSKLPWPDPVQVTLIDRQERFLFAPLLYELLSGEMEEWEVAPFYRDLIPASGSDEGNFSWRFVQGSVQHLDLEAKQITVGDSTLTDPTLTYDALVLALGGEPSALQVPGVADHAYPFRTLEDAQRLKAALDTLEQQTSSEQEPLRVAVAGGGASGVELACKLADRLGSRGRIRLIERGSELLSGFLPSSQEAATQALQNRHIQVELNTEVLRVGSDFLQVQQSSDTTIRQDPVQVVIWAVGTQVNSLVRTLPLPRTERSQIQVSETLQVVGHLDLFALGDLAAVIDADGQAVPASAQAAFQEASYCAWNLWSRLTDVSQNRPLLPFRYQPMGELLSLGVDNALLSGLGLSLSGPLGYMARRLVYLSRLPTLDHQLKVGWNWLNKPLTLAFQELFSPQPSSKS